MPLLTEADTCRKYVPPKLYAAGWKDDQRAKELQMDELSSLLLRASKTRRLSATLSARFSDCSSGSQSDLFKLRRWPPAGERVRPNPGIEVRVCNEWKRVNENCAIYPKYKGMLGIVESAIGRVFCYPM